MGRSYGNVDSSVISFPDEYEVGTDVKYLIGDVVQHEKDTYVCTSGFVEPEGGSEWEDVEDHFELYLPGNRQFVEKWSDVGTAVIQNYLRTIPTEKRNPGETHWWPHSYYDIYTSKKLDENVPWTQYSTYTWGKNIGPRIYTAIYINSNRDNKYVAYVAHSGGNPSVMSYGGLSEIYFEEDDLPANYEYSSGPESFVSADGMGILISGGSNNPSYECGFLIGADQVLSGRHQGVNGYNWFSWWTPNNLVNFELNAHCELTNYSSTKDGRTDSFESLRYAYDGEDYFLRSVSGSSSFSYASADTLEQLEWFMKHLWNPYNPAPAIVGAGGLATGFNRMLTEMVKEDTSSPNAKYTPETYQALTAVSSDKRIFGSINCLVEDVTGSTDQTHFTISANTPSLFLNYTDSSYYVRCALSAKKEYSLLAGVSYYDVYLPSYRICFDYESGVNPFASRVSFTGYKPIPIDTDEIVDEDIKNKIKELEDGNIVLADSYDDSDNNSGDDSGNDSPGEDTDDEVLLSEKPAVAFEGSTQKYKKNGCFTSGVSGDNVWMACINNVGALTVNGKNPIQNAAIVKSADFYYYSKYDGIEPYVVPYIYIDRPDETFQQMSRNVLIKPNLDTVKNLGDITGMSMEGLTNEGDGFNRYAFNYLCNDSSVISVCNGRMSLKRAPGSSPITAVYSSDNTAVINPAVDSKGVSLYTIPAFKDNEILQNVKIDHESENFEAFKIDSSYSSMVLEDSYSPEMVEAVTGFFNHYNVPAPTGGKVYFKNTVFDDIETVVYTNIGDLLEDGYHVVYDSADLDVTVVPKLTDYETEILKKVLDVPAVDPSIIATLISGSTTGKWYIWIDKSNNNVGSNIKLEIIDCRAKKSDGNWAEYNIDDVTEKLVSSNGSYVLPEYAEPFDVDSSDFAVSRLKIRFRLYVDGDSLYLNDDGCRVVLSYRVDSGGESRDFITFEKRMNPYFKMLDHKEIEERTAIDRSYKVFIDGKCDSVKPRCGVVYGDCSISVVDEKVAMDAVLWDDDSSETISKWIDSGWGYTPTTVKIYDINGYETSNTGVNHTVEGGLYYVVSSWDENFLVGTDSIKVKHFVGSYYRHLNKNDYEFKLKENAEIKIMDRYRWDADNNRYVLSISSAPGENKILKTTNSSNDAWYDTTDPLKIYELFVNADNLREYGLFIENSGITSDDGYSMMVGSVDSIAAEIDWGGSLEPLNVSPDMFESDVRGNLSLRIFLTSRSRGKIYPGTYISYHLEEDGCLLYDRGYYKMYGGFSVGFNEPAEIDITDSIIGSPDLSGGKFCIVNGFKIFGIGANYDIDGLESGGNGIRVHGIKTGWRVICYDGPSGTGNVVWDTGENYVFSINSNQARFMVGVTKDGTGVGVMPYEADNWSLKCIGECVISYDVIVGNVVVGSTDASQGVGTPYIFSPIRVAVEPQMYFMNPVIGYHDIAVLINETDNSKGIYSSYDLDMDCGVSWTDIPSDVKMIRDRMNFSYDMDTVGSVKGKLSSGWSGDKNDEGLEWITSINHPFLFVVNKEGYQENVNRVIGGQKLKYPYSRKDVLMPPNEWVTAENINRRFDMIDENLKYLANQTKVYSKPPIKYCGYYGDFQSNENGSYSRSYGGYVPVTDKALYKKYSELTSIDDEETAFRGIRSICVDVGDYDLGDINPDQDRAYQSYTDECANNNMYVCLGDKIKIVNTLTYIQNLSREDIVPKRVNEFMDDISRIAYSNDTGFLYCLSTKTHKVYIFNQYDNTMVGDPQNASYYGEIGGYGGPAVPNKFNNPTDLFISTVSDGDGNSHDEMWVCDTGNNVVKHYTIKGQWINTIDLSTLDGFKVVSVCCDYKNRVFILAGSHVFVFDSDGNLKYVFELHEKLESAKLIRSQYNAEFIYVLYDHFVEKYTSGGEYVAKFAENDGLTYSSMCADRKHNLYIGTNKNILHYCDGLRMMELGQTENADDFKWKMDEIYLKRNENIQDSVFGTSLQRMYDNIQMYCMCVFGRVVDVVSDTDESRVSDVDYVVRDDIRDSFHKERIFVGVNELVTCDTINRSFELMYDLLEKILAAI